MDAKLQSRYSALESSRKALFESLDALSKDHLKFQPEAGKWSIVEVLQHLLWAEEGAYQYMIKKNRAETLPKTGLGAAARITALKVALKLPFKYKAPAVAAKPNPDLPYDNIKSQWKASRQNLKDFLDKLPPERINAVIFKHPFAGYLNINQTFTFFEEHFDHHLQQIERIRKLENFPKD